jgi:DNA gyrase subunit A
LDFRFDTIRKRFEYDLLKLRDRIHLLEGFEKIFDALDEAIQLIRSSEGKRDAGEKLMDRFGLDDLQADAILEIKLYKLAKLEILAVITELAEKRHQAGEIEAILASDTELWRVVSEELTALRKEYGKKRNTLIGGPDAETIEYSEDDYIVSEDAFVVVTREGWIKRQSSFSTVAKIRVREGDDVAWMVKASTRSTVTFYTDKGTAFTMRVDDIQATTGYGGPVQKHFKFQAGEKVVGVISHDARNLPSLSPQLGLAEDDLPPPPYGVAITKGGRGLRFSIQMHSPLSTKNGRRCVRLSDPKDAVVAIYQSDASEFVSLASRKGNILSFHVGDLSVVKSAGKGFLAMKLSAGDSILAFELAKTQFEGATVVTPQGREEVARFSKFKGKRGARGAAVIRRGSFTTWHQRPSLIAENSQTGEAK